MQQNTKPVTLEEAANIYGKMLFPGGRDNMKTTTEDFKAGGEWQKEQDKYEIEELRNRIMKGREYLMCVEDNKISVSDALVALGFSKTGLNS